MKNHVFRKYSGEGASDVHVTWGLREEAQASFLLLGDWLLESTAETPQQISGPGTRRGRTGRMEQRHEEGLGSIPRGVGK